MKLTRVLFNTAVCISSSLLWISCQKNGLTEETVQLQTERIVNDVVADDPALMAKVPVIMSSDFFNAKMKTLLINAKVTPGKGNPKGGGGGGGSTTDNTAPTISIVSPISGSNVPDGSTVYITITASDNVGISTETFSLDGTLQASVNGTTGSFTWNTNGVSGGAHTITVTAKDVAGNTGSASVVITVNATIISPPPSTSSGYQMTMPPVTSQGSEGSCVAFAIGYNARSAEQYYTSGAASYGYASNIFSPEYLFDQTKADLSCSGSATLTALDFLKNSGICTWQTVPYTSGGCSLTPTASQISEAANFKISSYATTPTTDITALKSLLTLNHPLIISFMVDSYFYYAGPGFIWKSPSPTLYGRHSLAICGFDDAKHAFKVINSWGTGWGDAGYSWIDYDFLSVVSVNAYSIWL